MKIRTYNKQFMVGKKVEESHAVLHSDWRSEVGSLT